MKILSSPRIQWFALLFAVLIVSVTYMLSASGKVQVNADALKMFAPLPAVMTSPDNPVSDAKVTPGQDSVLRSSSLGEPEDFLQYLPSARRLWRGIQEPYPPASRTSRGSVTRQTVYNAAGHFVQFWDGRAPTVEEQAKGPITNPVEMAHVLQQLRRCR